MSCELPSGLRAKTGYLPDGDINGPWRHYAEIGYGPEATMAEAVDAVKTACTAPELLADPVFRGFVDYLKSMYPQKFDELEQFHRLISILPGAPQDYFGDIEDGESHPMARIDMLGQSLDRNDVIGFTFYLLTNTTLEGPKDPRIDFLNGLRSDITSEE